MHTSSTARPDPLPASGEGLVACPVCDVLHHEVGIAEGARARCRRCGTLLYAPRRSAMTQIVMLAATAAILMVAAIFFPFLELQAGGLSRQSSVFDAVLAFSEGMMVPLSVAVGALIVVLPFARLCAIAYALAPMVFGAPPAAHAATAMRWAEAVRPWAMAEIFIVGVAVALVKVAGLAKVTPGPAFWAFAALVLVTVLKDNLMCKFTVWKTLEERRTS
ncbi:paraquat-inducible protein A [Defluviimonas sp. SAOS-178_SWC]|uniref:paraquat-inducible protein A n=1 Tax=Defluviimonas sp. SAOS-178_SWC TaxID=3121287 RepID=UPI003221495C